MHTTEIWAGLECTINRVGDFYSDQCKMNGHDTRRALDLEMFASLGVSKLRYPVLWEWVAPEGSTDFNWRDSDASLSQLQNLRLDPIVGLLHHGSGPKNTSLVDPEFPEKLEAYATAVAQRYPWVENYTPVNEPLTTARFSGLYGIWYPHGRAEESFVRALLNEIKGTILSMRAIRKINPKAKLVQTEDLGRTTGTSPLLDQIEFENLRRWLTFDLLCGWVTEHHGLYAFLRRSGATERELAWFVENKYPPNILGINHYPLSNRFLDHRLELYPVRYHGGNGRQNYADVGAVDTGQATYPMPLEILSEVWERYGLPFAVTETHIAGPREAQMRWLKEVWDAAQTLCAGTADLRAVTAWALLGAFDWSTLCTTTKGSRFYESGVFDVRSVSPRPTALAKMIQMYAQKKEPNHPVLDQPGYWRDSSRVLFAPDENPTQPQPRQLLRLPQIKPSARTVVITGATGTLGRAFAQACDIRGTKYRLLSRAEMDITSADRVRAVLQELHPWAVINAAGYAKIDRAENEPERCRSENAMGPATLAAACAEAHIPLLTFSSDFVFSGDRNEPYCESHPTGPLNIFGRSKLEGERQTAERHDHALIVRTSSFFGAPDRRENQRGFFEETLRSLRAGQPVKAAEKMRVSPTYLPDLVSSCLDLLIDGEKGIVHLANEGEVSWADWARLAADIVKAPRSLVVGCEAEELGFVARRPLYSVLASERLRGFMPSFERALGVYANELQKLI